MMRLASMPMWVYWNFIRHSNGKLGFLFLINCHQFVIFKINKPTIWYRMNEEGCQKTDAQTLKPKEERENNN